MIILYLVIVFASLLLLLKSKKYKSDRLEKLDLSEHKLHKLYGVAMFLHDKTSRLSFIKRLKERGPKDALTDKKLKELYVVENTDEIKYWFDIKKIALGFAIVFFFALLGLFVSTNELINGSTPLFEVRRASPGEGESIVNVSVESRGKDAQTIELELAERELTKEETEELFEETYNELLEKMPAEGESLDEVMTKVNLPDSIGLVKITWEFDGQEGLIDYSGEVIADFEDREEYISVLTANMECNDYFKSYEIPIRIVPQNLSFFEQIQKSLQKFVEGEDKTKEAIELPNEIEGNSLKYTNVASHDGRYYIVLCILGAVLAPLLYKKTLDSKLKKRNEEMLDDYPEIVSKLALLNEAGLTLLSAWFRVLADGEKSGLLNHFAYKEMRFSYNKIKNGEPEGAEYLAFGKRCNIHSYIKLGNLLEQNLLKGNAGLSRSLRLEAEQAIRDKKRRIRQKGEKCGTKLLFPMILMMMVVVIIVIVPALMSMDL